MGIDQERLYATNDARVWAEEWCKIAREIEEAKDGRKVIDESWMIGWFANAMSVAESYATKKDELEVVVLPRDALFEFFGMMALPPWKDVDGSSIGEHIDCAPIAEEITKWVKQHDLTELYAPKGRD